jgi:hypothetical protein
MGKTMRIKNIKIRPAILLGEFILGIIGTLLAYQGHYEGALGVVGVIGSTLNKAFESEEKGE